MKAVEEEVKKAGKLIDDMKMVKEMLDQLGK